MAGDIEGKPRCDVSRGRKRGTVSAAELSTVGLGSHVVQQRSSPALQGGVFSSKDNCRRVCKEIQPVHPKGNQSSIFIGTTDAEAETPILWPPDAKK